MLGMEIELENYIIIVWYGAHYFFLGGKNFHSININSSAECSPDFLDWASLLAIYGASNRCFFFSYPFCVISPGREQRFFFICHLSLSSLFAAAAFIQLARVALITFWQLQFQLGELLADLVGKLWVHFGRNLSLFARSDAGFFHSLCFRVGLDKIAFFSLLLFRWREIFTLK